MSHDQELAEAVTMMAELFTETVGISPDMLVRQQVKFMEDVSSALRDLVELQKQRHKHLGQLVEEHHPSVDPLTDLMRAIKGCCEFNGSPPNGFLSWDDWMAEAVAANSFNGVSLVFEKELEV